MQGVRHSCGSICSVNSQCFRLLSLRATSRINQSAKYHHGASAAANGSAGPRRQSFSNSRLWKPARQGFRGRDPGANVPFKDALKPAIAAARRELMNAPIVKYLEDEGRDFEGTFEDFEEIRIGKRPPKSMNPAHVGNMSRDQLSAEYAKKGHDGLLAKIKYGFYGYVSELRLTEREVENQTTLANLRFPAEWYPGTRKMHRKVHLHIGPTNSGKTYHALKSLEAAESGVYAGPLRLLAHEVFSRLNAKGKPCALVTGEERRLPPGIDPHTQKYITSCTVEMVPMNRELDVAVIDEIQMLGSEDRGWAWTQALLGVRAKEIHLCGETRTKELIEQLCAMSGDELIIHDYDRLSPLMMDKQSLAGDLHQLRKGDCIVSFSIMSIHALRKAIEEATGKNVAIVYGGLPPETRAQQARLFNDPDNDYDFLVASDAIGMGLNLSIKRIIFETTVKFDGEVDRVIDIPSLKQIAGRAGRYKPALSQSPGSEKDEDLSAAKGETAEDVNLVLEEVITAEKSILQPTWPERKDSWFEETIKTTSLRAPQSTDKSNAGLVTTLHKQDFSVVQSALTKEPPPIRTSGMLPPESLIDRFAQCFPPGTPFSYVLIRLNEIAQMSHRFHLCGLRDALWIADLIEPVRGLSIDARMIFTSAPAGRSDLKTFNELIPELARAVEKQSGGALYDVLSMPLEVLEGEIQMTRPYLRSLETLHKSVVLYLWLSFRFHGIFSTRALAAEVKQRVEERIEKVLAGLSMQYKAKNTQNAIAEHAETQKEDETVPLSEDMQDLLKDGLQHQARP